MKTANMPSPFGDSSNAPKIIVVHSMGEYIDTEGIDYHATEFLKHMRYSVHAMVTPTGVVLKCRDYHQGANHAKSHNANSLGVEFLVPGLHNYVTFLEAIKNPYISKEQYAAGQELIREWLNKMQGNPDAKSVIKRHSDIDPQRKVDPGDGFPWKDFINDLR